MEERRGGGIPLHYPQGVPPRLVSMVHVAHIDLLIIMRVWGKDHCWCPYNLNSDRLTFSNICQRTSRRIALPLLSPETLSSLS